MAHTNPKSGRKPIVIVVVGAVVIAGGVFAWANLAGERSEADRLLAEVKETPEEQRMEAMRKMHEQSRDLSEEERRKLHRGMRDMFMEEVSRHIDEYENAPEDQKQAILDRQIDEMVKRMEEWRVARERRRAEREAAGENGDSPPRGPGAGGPGEGARAGGGDGAREGGREGGPPGGRRDGWGGRSVQDRKERMEGGNPDQRARMIRHFMRMRARAEERGISMGPGGRRGSGR